MRGDVNLKDLNKAIENSFSRFYSYDIESSIQSILDPGNHIDTESLLEKIQENIQTLGIAHIPHILI